MKDKNTLKQYIYIVLLVITLILISKSTARFTANKKHDGNINIKNHPCKGELGPGAKYIINKEGGLDYIKSKPAPDFSKIADTKEGMFMAEDDCGESYYFRGVSDNWVSFAGFYWRIIRINGDGSIRLIYSGTKENNTGNGAEIGVSKYKAINDASAYYDTSTIKTIVDNWYKTNIQDKGYDNKIANTGYCNDMSEKSSYLSSSYYRLHTNKTPLLKCPNKDRDLLSKSNNKLTYPVGLLAHDEVSFAGGIYSNYNTPYVNKNYYLYTGKKFWTMTPAEWDNDDGFVGSVEPDGSLGYDYMENSQGVRPVLSLKSEVLVSAGNGTELNPYIVS